MDTQTQTSLNGRIIIVTGGGSGIGEAAALLIAQRGAAVMVADMNEAGGKSIVARIAAMGGQADFRRTDVGNNDDVAALVEATVARFGGLNGAFNNAGIFSAGTRLSELTLDYWHKVIAVNLTGVFLCLKHQIAYMERHGGGAGKQGNRRIGRMGQPREIAEAAAWLLSDATSFVTGAVLSVDGGYTAA